jgi:hypothetical protein
MNWANWVLVAWFLFAVTMNAIQMNKPDTDSLACSLNVGIGLLGVYVATQAGVG